MICYTSPLEGGLWLQKIVCGKSCRISGRWMPTSNALATKRSIANVWFMLKNALWAINRNQKHYACATKNHASDGCNQLCNDLAMQFRHPVRPHSKRSLKLLSLVYQGDCVRLASKQFTSEEGSGTLGHRRAGIGIELIWTRKRSTWNNNRYRRNNYMCP